MLIENVKKVEHIWKSESLSIAKPLSKNAVIESFAKLNIQLSKDVIEVYSNIGGMIDENMDSTCFSFWTFERILAENKPNSELVFFSDFLINSHWYGFKFENEKTSSIHIFWAENQIENIADSFNDFFENYIVNPGKYYLFDREN